MGGFCPAEYAILLREGIEMRTSGMYPDALTLIPNKT